MADLKSFAMSLPLPALSSAERPSPAGAMEASTQPVPAKSDNVSLCHAALKLAVLKLTEVDPDAESSSQFSTVAQQLIESWQRLVAVIDELRSLSRSDLESPLTDGLPNLPQTPEAIIPYVLEEVYDVLDRLQAPVGNKNLFVTAQPLPAQPSLLQHYFLLETLAPWLLWGMASSAYEMMQMMEGITVRVFQPGQGWQTGVLRLAALLEFESTDLNPEPSWLIDLATYAPPNFLLTPEVLLQSDDCQVCQQPILSQELLQRFVNQLKTSVLHRFLEGVEITLLMPQKVWQSGLLYLRPRFEFIAATEDEVADWVLSADSSPPVTEVTVIATTGETIEILPSGFTRSALQFTDADWQKQYAATIVKHLQEQSLYCYWKLLLPQLPDSPNLTIDSDPISLLVKQAWEASQTLNTSLTLSSRNFLHQPIAIPELLRRLLWCLSSTAFEAMLLMGGIPADLLQTESDWSTGTLRLLMTLDIQTPELDWHLDIATGQAPQPVITLPPDTVVRSNQCKWCHQPDLITHLLSCIYQQIDRSIPELQLLCQGTSADILMAGQTWQSGAVRLSFDFEFVAFD
jgi:hypothetical protein